MVSESHTEDVAVADSITQNYPEEQSFHFRMNPDTPLQVVESTIPPLELGQAF